MPLRVLIYARGTADEIAVQQAACHAVAEALDDHEIVSLASDPPEGSTGWISANAMVANGEADRILVATRDAIPLVVESITRMLPGRRPRRLKPE